MIYVLCLILGIAIGWFLAPTEINYNDEKEIKDELKSIGLPYSKHKLDEYNSDEIWIAEFPRRKPREIENLFASAFQDWIDNTEPESHQSYLSNLEQYKSYVDESPNKFLKFHLEDALSKEQYELAEYIKQTAKKRNFEL